MPLILTSESFQDGDILGHQHVLSEAYGFGCNGGNLSPALSWSGVPDGTKSFAVSCFDPDAPTGSGFWHWFVVNIPAEVRSLSLGAGDPRRSGMPKSALEIRTDFGKPGYGGPCPPPGAVHRYVFAVHALSVERIPVTADTSCALVGFHVNASTLARAKLLGRYRR